MSKKASLQSLMSLLDFHSEFVATTEKSGRSSWSKPDTLVDAAIFFAGNPAVAREWTS
jgi:hypothetical protein